MKKILSMGLAIFIIMPILVGTVSATDKQIIQRIVPELELNVISGFSEGLASVKSVTGCGYIDKFGALVIPFDYEEAEPFNEGLAAVKKDNKWGFIDKTGDVVVPFEYDAVLSFNEGLAVVSKKKDEKDTNTMHNHGYIDKTGKVVVPLIYDFAYSYSEGLAAVRKNNKTGYIDKTGKIVIPLEYNSAYSFSEGLAAVNKDWQFYHIDKTNNIILRGYNSLPFSEGLAVVGKTGNSIFGFINKFGELVLPFEYDFAYSFSEGLAAVTHSKDNKTGYINKTGEFFLYGIYDNVLPFKNGLAAIGKNGKWGFINKTGEIVVPLEYDEFYSFNEGLAVVMKKYKEYEKWSILEIAYTQVPITKTITVTFGATKYMLNDEPFNEQTMIYEGVAYLPAAYLAKKLGLNVYWDSSINTTTLTSTGKKPLASSENSDFLAFNSITKQIIATFGATQYILNGEPFDEQTIVYNGVAYLPAAYLATKLGLRAKWDAKTNITTLTFK